MVLNVDDSALTNQGKVGMWPSVESWLNVPIRVLW